MFIVTNHAGVALELSRAPAFHSVRYGGTTSTFPAGGVLMQGDAATAFHFESDAETAIWRTITWAERIAERDGHRRFEWASEYNFRIVPVYEAPVEAIHGGR